MEGAIAGRNGGTLIPLQKGQKLPGGGRKKGSQNFETVIKRMLEISQKGPDPFSTEKDEKKKPIVELTLMEQVVLAQVKQALGGSTQAAEWLAARGFGKMIQQTAVSVNAGHNTRYESLETIEEFKAALREVEEEESRLENEAKAEAADFEEL